MEELKQSNQLEWTGERVIEEKMQDKDPIENARLKKILYQHLARYHFAASYCFEKSILDAACGSGYGTELLGKLSSKILGVDNDEKTIEYAENYRTSKVKFEVCDLEKDFPQGEFDTIISFETIEHLKDPNLFLSNVAKHCKTFIFSIPLNNKSQFHLGVYNLIEAQELIGKYFKNVTWYKQSDIIIESLSEPTDKCRFLIGVTKI